MGEIIRTYKLDDLEQAIPMERKEFYAEQMSVFGETGKPTRSVEIIQVLLFTPEGELILQKRSKKKAHNPNMFDKTIGGHIPFTDSPNYTVMCETLQELEIPAFVLNGEDDFKKTYKLLNKYVGRSALIQFIDKRTYNSKKKVKGETVEIANTYNFYLGVYQGAIRPADKEAAGVVFFDFDTLQDDIAEAPNLYTLDLQFFLKKYDKEIRNFLKHLKSA